MGPVPPLRQRCRHAQVCHDELGHHAPAQVRPRPHLRVLSCQHIKSRLRRTEAAFLCTFALTERYLTPRFPERLFPQKASFSAQQRQGAEPMRAFREMNHVQNIRDGVEHHARAPDGEMTFSGEPSQRKPAPAGKPERVGGTGQSPGETRRGANPHRG